MDKGRERGGEDGRENKYAFYIFSSAWLARLCMYVHTQL